MRSQNEQKLIEPTAYKDLQVLSEVEGDPEITQRQLSLRLGIALGLTNVLLRNLVKKGCIRANQTTWRKWLYTITPDGFSHKLRLTVAYIQRVLDHYQAVRQNLREYLEPLTLNSESRVAIYGIGEFAELVYLGLKEFGIEEIDIYVLERKEDGKFLGMPIKNVEILHHEDFDRIVVSSLDGQSEGRSRLMDQGVPADKIVTLFANGKSGEDWS